MSCISRPKQPLGWGSPCHRLHMNSLRYSCYLLTIDQVSTDHRPSVDQLLTDTSVKHRRTIGEVLVKYRWTKSYIGQDTSGTTIDRASTECCPTIVRVLTDYWPQYWPSLDWLSTDYRPLFRPIDRSTLPTVNRIRSVIHTVGTIQSNLTISNSVNLKSPLFRRKIECSLINASPLRFPSYFEAPLFRTFSHFPWGFEIAGFDCVI